MRLVLTALVLGLLVPCSVSGQRPADTEILKAVAEMASDSTAFLQLRDYLAERPAGDTSNQLAEVFHKAALRLSDGNDEGVFLYYLEEALRIRRGARIVPQTDLARSEFLRFLYLTNRGRLLEAKSWISRALDHISIASQEGEPRAYGKYLGNYLFYAAYLATQLSDCQLSLHYIDRLENLAPDQHEGGLIAYINSLRGDAYRECNRYPEAIESYLTDLSDILNRGGSEAEIMTLYGNLAISQVEAGTYGAARASLEEAIAMVDRLLEGGENFYEGEKIRLLGLGVRLRGAGGTISKKISDQILELSVSPADRVQGARTGSGAGYFYTQLAVTAPDPSTADRYFLRAFRALMDTVIINNRTGLPRIGGTVILDDEELIQTMIEFRNWKVTSDNLEGATAVQPVLDTLMRRPRERLFLVASLEEQSRKQLSVYEDGIDLGGEVAPENGTARRPGRYLAHPREHEGAIATAVLIRRRVGRGAGRTRRPRPA